MPTNWPDRMGAVGRGLLRFGAALCAKKPSSRRSENHCIYRKSFEFNSKCQRAGLPYPYKSFLFRLMLLCATDLATCLVHACLRTRAASVMVLQAGTTEPQRRAQRGRRITRDRSSFRRSGI